MKKSFKSTIEELEKQKQNKNKHFKSMRCLAMNCLLGIATTTLGITLSIESGIPITSLLLPGGALTCTTIGLIIRKYLQYKKQNSNLDNSEEKKIR